MRRIFIDRRNSIAIGKEYDALIQQYERRERRKLRKQQRRAMASQIRETVAQYVQDQVRKTVALINKQLMRDNLRLSHVL